jgi:hypothetical protein
VVTFTVTVVLVCHITVLLSPGVVGMGFVKLVCAGVVVVGRCLVGLGNPNPTGGMTTISLPPNGVGMGVARGGGSITR